jgi:hypothetical protein
MTSRTVLPAVLFSPTHAQQARRVHYNIPRTSTNHECAEDGEYPDSLFGGRLIPLRQSFTGRIAIDVRESILPKSVLEYQSTISRTVSLGDRS